MNKRRILTGITATGKLTIGNYIGAIKQIVQFQNEYEVFLFIANMHGITIPYNKEDLKSNSLDIAALYFACGVDPKKVTVFLQSKILAHTQLQYILMCNTNLGQLERMTQFKDKSQKVRSNNGTEFIPTGILIYPTLMASDILLYSPDLVPVGIDQKQHIELTRDIAETMNKKFGKDLFKVPAPLIKEVGSKIMDLKDPTKKMSKSSDDPKTYISLLDDPEVAKKKIVQAMTDSENKVVYNWDAKPGVSNLITIYSELTDLSIKDVEHKYSKLGYKEFKSDLGDIVKEFLTNLQKKYYEYRNSEKLIDLLEDGRKKAQAIADKKLEEVQDKNGINAY